MFNTALRARISLGQHVLSGVNATAVLSVPTSHESPGGIAMDAVTVLDKALDERCYVCARGFTLSVGNA